MGQGRIVVSLYRLIFDLWKTKSQFRLRGCACWSATLFSACNTIRFGPHMISSTDLIYAEFLAVVGVVCD